MVKYVSERIVNIAELERHIDVAFILSQLLEKELQKDNPSISDIKGLSKGMFVNLSKAKDFEFCVERRTTIEASPLRAIKVALAERGTSND